MISDYIEKMQRLKHYLECCGDGCHGYIADIDDMCVEIEALRRQVEIAARSLREMNDECAALNGANLLINTEVENKDKRIAELEAAIRSAYEVYAFVPETAPEAYCLQIITDIVAELRDGLKGEVMSEQDHKI